MGVASRVRTERADRIARQSSGTSCVHAGTALETVRPNVAFRRSFARRKRYAAQGLIDRTDC